MCIPTSINCPINFISFSKPDPNKIKAVEPVQVDQDGETIFYISRAASGSAPFADIIVTQGSGVC